MDEPQASITVEEAKRALAIEGERRRQVCLVAIRQVLQEHGCALVAVPDFTEDGRITAKLQIRDAEL